jgi:hypothetical protein
MMIRSVARQEMKSQPMWVIDLREWLDRLFFSDEVPQLNVSLKKLGEIITYATANTAGISVDFQPGCWRRPNRKACRGVLEIELVPENHEIRWRCPACGNAGAVTGWKGEIWDMTSNFAYT